MAFRFGDPGGRVYGSAGSGNANFLAYWGIVAASFGTWSVQAAGGRSGGSSIRFTTISAGQTNYLTKSLDSQPTWGVAFAMRFSVLTNGIVAAFDDSGTNQVDLRVNADGSFSITRNGTVLGTTQPILAINSYCHVELKTTIHPSAGTAQLWVNGSQRLNLSSQNTRATANSSANQFRIGGASTFGSTSLAADWDDLIVYDGQTTDANGNADITGPIGDCALTWLLPTGAGTTTQFTPSTGSNFAAVDDAIPNGDTDYVESTTVGQKDTYALADLPANIVTVKSVAMVHYVRKTDAGSRQMGAVLRSGGTDYTHPTGVDLSDSYLYSFRNWGSNPSGAAAWTPTAVNALEVGQVVNS